MSAAFTDRGFYASAQASPSAQKCNAMDLDDAGANDVFGCTGEAGTIISGTCEPWHATLEDGCTTGMPTGWSCMMGSYERDSVIKAVGPGGVLCCAD